MYYNISLRSPGIRIFLPSLKLVEGALRRDVSKH